MAQQRTFGGRIIRFIGADDATLESLYANSWITLYPSLGEGYGLPVAEALARGKACLATNSGGLAEIAPNLVDLIDPDSPEGLVKRILEYLSTPGLLVSKEASIRSDYRPTRWEETALAVRSLLERAITSMHSDAPQADARE